MRNRLKEIVSQGRVHLTERSDGIPQSRLMIKVPRRCARDDGTCRQLIRHTTYWPEHQRTTSWAGGTADADAADRSRFERYRRWAMQRVRGIFGQSA